MKKIYIIPATQVTEISCEKLIADSLTIDGTKTAEENAGGFVKGESASTPSYNVWEDDWSK